MNLNLELKNQNLKVGLCGCKLLTHTRRMVPTQDWGGRVRVGSQGKDYTVDITYHSLLSLDTFYHPGIVQPIGTTRAGNPDSGSLSLPNMEKHHGNKKESPWCGP